VSVAAILFRFDGRDEAVLHTRVRSDGRGVSSGAEAIHGISSREAARTGIPEITALSAVCHMAAQARFLTGFSVGFDRAVLDSSIIRLGQDPRRLIRPGLQVVDLQRPSCAFTKLPSERPDGSYRWPRLDDAMSGIRNERFFKARRGATHDALYDAKSSKRLFLSLLHRGALDIAEVAA
jgi:DNA polymerase III epsilon subunit-like protein